MRILVLIFLESQQEYKILDFVISGILQIGKCCMFL